MDWDSQAHHRDSHSLHSNCHLVLHNPHPSGQDLLNISFWKLEALMGMLR